MNHFFIKASVLLVVLSFVVSCKKYPEGPGFSLRPKKWRLSGSWHIEQLLVNGQDMTNAYFPNGQYWEGYEVGGYHEYADGGIAGPVTGTWKWVNRKTEILRTASYFGSNALHITILKLENNSFWYKFAAGTQEYELRLKQD